MSAAGGLLSHAAIVARECNIPTVVSVRGPNALTDGTLVSIDGWGGGIYHTTVVAYIWMSAEGCTC
ncbi:MAG: PEP-utilizing enzyme [Halobacteriota archaeon]